MGGNGFSGSPCTTAPVNSHVEVMREAPTPPRITEVVLRLSPMEAKQLRYFLNAAQFDYSHYQVDRVFAAELHAELGKAGIG